MKKTTQAHGVRGLDTPEQAQARQAQADKVENLSLKLHGLAEIVKLAAFADENPGSSDVLFYVADEMEGLRPGLEEACTVLARVASPSEATTAQEGGAA